MSSQYIPSDIQDKHDEYIAKPKLDNEVEEISHEAIIKKVKRCSVRTTKPTGPMTVCHDMVCLDECIAQTKRDLVHIKEKEEAAKNES